MSDWGNAIKVVKFKDNTYGIRYGFGPVKGFPDDSVFLALDELKPYAACKVRWLTIDLTNYHRVREDNLKHVQYLCDQVRLSMAAAYDKGTPI